MDLNKIKSLADSAIRGENGFKDLRWDRYMDNNKEFKRSDLWTFKMISPAPAIYYPGDEIINARLNDVSVTRESWNLPTNDPPKIRGFKPIGAQPNGPIDVSGTVQCSFVDKQDYAIELWMKSTRDLISHPITRFSYPIELLMSQMELTFHDTIQQRVKILTFINAVPKSITVGDEDPAEESSWSANYQYTWAFPNHTEEYKNIY
jgi:hypothetical protein